MGESVPWVPDDVSTLAAYRRENAALRAALAEAQRERDALRDMLRQLADAADSLAEHGNLNFADETIDKARRLAALAAEPGRDEPTRG